MIMQLLFLFMLLNLIILATIIYVFCCPFSSFPSFWKDDGKPKTKLFVIIIIIMYFITTIGPYAQTIAIAIAIAQSPDSRSPRQVLSLYSPRTTPDPPVDAVSTCVLLPCGARSRICHASNVDQPVRIPLLAVVEKRVPTVIAI